jgi:hypothetical protein
MAAVDGSGMIPESPRRWSDGRPAAEHGGSACRGRPITDAQRILLDEIAPIDDVRSTAEYGARGRQPGGLEEPPLA